MKRQATEWEKVFPNHISNKGLVSTIYKELSKFNNKKASDIIRKWAKEQKKTLHQRGYIKANKHIRRGYIKANKHIISHYRKMQSKTTTSYHYTAIRWLNF